MDIYSIILDRKKINKKMFAVLIDPDKPNIDELSQIIDISNTCNVDFFFIGGSLLTNNRIDEIIEKIKKTSKIPVIIFPGNPIQICNKADGILLLSLISGRNPDMLIGNHVIAAPFLKNSNLEIIPTGYMLIDSGKPTTALYISNTMPIPYDKDDIAACTAIAGELLGLKLIYMDGGSGAINPISAKMIEKVSNSVDLPVIIGGGISTKEKAYEMCKSGADVIVVGNAIEKSSSLIKEISDSVHSF